MVFRRKVFNLDLLVFEIVHYLEKCKVFMGRS